MSCLIQKPENTASIAEYIERLLNMDYQTNGISAPESLTKVLFDLKCSDERPFAGRYFFHAEKIYKVLVTMNHAAYLNRYTAPDAERVPEYKENRISKQTEYTPGEKGENGFYKDGHFKIVSWHYKLFKMIQFYNYQCLEDPTCETDLYKAMKDLESALALFIIQNSEQYTAQDWQ